MMHGQKNIKLIFYTCTLVSILL